VKEGVYTSTHKYFTSTASKSDYTDDSRLNWYNYKLYTNYWEHSWCCWWIVAT